MGVCREFGPQIHPDCDHPMRAGTDSCTCAHCGTHCTGRFPACAQVWERSTVAVAVRQDEPKTEAPTTEVAAAADVWAEPDIEQPAPEDGARPAPPPYVPVLTNRRAPWARRQFRPKTVAVGALALLGTLLAVAVVTKAGKENPDTLEVLNRPSTTQAPTSTAAAAPPSAPTTLPEPSTTSAPPPSAVAPAPPPSAVAPAPPPPQSARAAPARSTQPVRSATQTTVLRFPPMCGYVPGSPVDVEINGKPAGAQTADASGCVSRPPSGRR